MYVIVTEFNDGSGNHIVDCLLVELQGRVSVLSKYVLCHGTYLQVPDQRLNCPSLNASLICCL